MSRSSRRHVGIRRRDPAMQVLPTCGLGWNYVRYQWSGGRDLIGTGHVAPRSRASAPSTIDPGHAWLQPQYTIVGSSPATNSPPSRPPCKRAATASTPWPSLGISATTGLLPSERAMAFDPEAFAHLTTLAGLRGHRFDAAERRAPVPYPLTATGRPRAAVPKPKRSCPALSCAGRSFWPGSVGPRTAGLTARRLTAAPARLVAARGCFRSRTRRRVAESSDGDSHFVSEFCQ